MHVPFHHFKMETINSILRLVRKGCFMAKLDIKDAYYSIPVHEEDQKYLKFEFQGKLYKFTVLPNGYSSGPRKFTKALNPPLAKFRKELITLAAYIDDLITLATSFNICSNNVQKIVLLLDSLGFIDNPEKSVFTPTQTLEFLGFIINSVTMTVSLTSKKKLKIQELCMYVLQENNITIRLVATLLGKFTSSFPGVKLAKLHFRALEREKILALKISRGNFDKRIALSNDAKEDIKWWIRNIVDSYNTISPSNHDTIMKSDASKI